MAKLIVNYGGTAPRASLRVFNSMLFITRPKMRSEQPLICVVLHTVPDLRELTETKVHIHILSAKEQQLSVP